MLADSLHRSPHGGAAGGHWLIRVWSARIQKWVEFDDIPDTKIALVRPDRKLVEAKEPVPVTSIDVGVLYVREHQPGKRVIDLTAAASSSGSSSSSSSSSGTSSKASSAAATSKRGTSSHAPPPSGGGGGGSGGSSAGIRYS